MFVNVFVGLVLVGGEVVEHVRDAVDRATWLAYDEGGVVGLARDEVDSVIHVLILCRPKGRHSQPSYGLAYNLGFFSSPVGG